MNSGERPIFTEEETLLGGSLIRDAFRHFHFSIATKTAELKGGLIRADQAGYSLCTSSLLLTQAFIEHLKSGAILRGDRQEGKPTTALLDAAEGAGTLLAEINIGKQNPTGIEEQVGTTIEQIAHELEISTGSQISLSDKADMFLRGTNFFPVLRNLFQDEPSGFDLIDQASNQVDKEGSPLFLDAPYNPRIFFYRGFRLSGNLYKQFYRIGLDAGINAPKPPITK